MKNILQLTTAELRNYPADGSLFVGYDDQDYGYWGMTEQANGDMVVHLEYADGGAERHDIEVAKADMDEPYWEM
jgi:hypothetical protein